MSHGNSTRGSVEAVCPRTGILGMCHGIVQGLGSVGKQGRGVIWEYRVNGSVDEQQG